MSYISKGLNKVACPPFSLAVGLRASPDTARGRIEKGRHMEKDHTMKKTRRWSAMVLSVLWLLVAHVTTAGERPVPPFGVFTMLEGQGVEVCEACFKALEAAASGPDRVVFSGCERPYDPELGFATPKWTQLNPLKHLAIVREVMMFVRPPDPEHGIVGTIYDGDNFKREIKTEMKYGRIAISVVMIDIDNDGQPEPVLKFRDGVCGNPQNRSASRSLIVLSPDRKRIDQAKTEVVTQNERKRPERPIGSVTEQIYDVFSYHGQNYFDRWNNGGLEPDTFSVYRATGNKVSRLCKYRYERRYRSQIPGGTP